MYILFFILAAVSLCIGVYKIATSYQKDSRDAEGRVEGLQLNKYSTDMNRYAARKESKAAASRSGLASQLASEAESIAKLAAKRAEAIAAEEAAINAPLRLAEARAIEQEATINTLTVTK